MIVQDLPDELLAIVKLAVQKHNEPQPAIEEAHKSVRKRPEFQAWVDLLVQTAVAELVYRERAVINTRLKAQAGEYGKPAKVSVGQSDAVNEVYTLYYQYKIGGTILGNVMGEELAGIGEKERALSEGHLFNARLCEELARFVPEGKRVQDCVSERKLKVLFTRLQGERDKAA